MSEKLKSLHATWVASGSPEQESFDLEKFLPRWTAAFPQHKDFLLGLPQSLSRENLRNVCSARNICALEKFLAVMVWGYGDRAYGPFRVERMFLDPESEAKIIESYNFADSGQPKKAFEYLGMNRIDMLGPSFSTKFISFCTPRSIGAPIYDSFIILWLNSFADFRVSKSSTYSNKSVILDYSRYWDWVKEKSIEFECFPDQIELLIFRDSENIFAANSAWKGK
jgi:hypothetical protein